MCENERTRLVVLGGPAVGKTAIVRRFLDSTFTDKYKSTVEDLHSRTFNLGPITIKVDILDTCGDSQFPAMRRLSIATASAFLLVYSITSEDSVTQVKACLEEVREQRADWQELPIVLAGNKSDLASAKREVCLEDVSEWLYCSLPRFRMCNGPNGSGLGVRGRAGVDGGEIERTRHHIKRTKLMECSAKDGHNIQEIFRCFVTLAKIMPPATTEETPLKRRSSAYGSRRGGSPASTSGNLTPTTSNPKPRSRSLIRRSSRKTKQCLSESNPESDCHMS